MKFEIGDKVKIRRDLKNNVAYNKILFVKEMKKYKGKIAKIVKKEANFYKIDIDNEHWNWADDMFETAWQFSKEDLRDGDIITLRSDAEFIKIGETIQNEYVTISLEDFTENLEDSMMPRNNKEIIKVKRPIEYKTIFERKEILDETEKKYLSNIIKPFRDRVNTIEKMANSCQCKKGYIRITIKRDSSIVLPYFELETMYKGMEQGKEYTLKELGLDDED